MFYEQLAAVEGARCIYFPINASMYEDFNSGNTHNYAYHINVSGSDSTAGAWRLDWEFYFEGTPDYTVHNAYLPVPG